MTDKSTRRTWFLDIMHPVVFGFQSLDALCSEFMQAWGEDVPPAAVCLPVFSHAGPWFENALHLRPYAVERANVRGILISNAAREANALGLQVVLVVDPGVKWLSENLEIVDVRGRKSAQPCIYKRRTRDLLVTFLRSCIETVTRYVPAERIHVALDTVDLWPMGAEGERLSLTCFCDECRQRMGQAGVSVADFEEVPGPWNLALADSGTGISFINTITADFSRVTPEGLLHAAEVQGFIRAFANATQAVRQTNAQKLLQYMEVRHAMSVEAVGDIFARLSGLAGGRRIIIGECMEYDWTGGTFLARLDSADVCDELWYDYDQPFFTPEEVHMRVYAAARSRYTLDAFWSLIDHVRDSSMMATTGLGKVKSIEALLQTRSRLALAACAPPSPLTRLTLPLDRDRVLGYVAPAMTDAIAGFAITRAVEGAPQTIGKLREASG